VRRMASLRIDGLRKRFGALDILKGIDLAVEDGEFLVLVGPSGCGKSTLLNLVAGLDSLSAGEIRIGDRVVNAVHPKDRNIAMVFQSYALYPNMTVFENLAFPLRSPRRRVPENEIRVIIKDTAEKLKITHLLDRKTARLSGGEMQRVSIGRAIVRQPRVFLMDEPLSNLDAKLREGLRVELEHMQKTQGSTTIFVTHDQIEALTMAHRIAVLNHGRIAQIGSPHDIYDRPATQFVATLVGTPRINLLPANRDNGTLHVKNSPVSVPAPPSNGAGTLMLGIRPEDVLLTPAGKFGGEVALTEPLGVETIVHIKTGAQTLLSIVPGMTPVRIGDNVQFDIAQDRLHYFDLAGQRI